MLSAMMIEKLREAGAKQPLGSAPLNLSAMLDFNGGHKRSEDGSETSTDSKDSNEAAVKEEANTDENDIRAQFFADLMRRNDNKNEALNNDSNHPPTIVKTLNEFSNGDRSSHSVTLKVREDDESLPPRKRKFSHENSLSESPGDCKKLVIEDDLEPAIKLETTSY